MAVQVDTNKIIHSLGAHSSNDLPKYDLNKSSNSSLDMSLGSEDNDSKTDTKPDDKNDTEDVIDEILEITLTNGEEVWFCKEYIEAVKSMGMEIDQHTELLKKALIQQDREKKQFNYILENNENDKTLKVLFVVEPSGDFVAATINLKRLESPKKAIMLMMQDFRTRHLALRENNEHLFEVASSRQESMQLASLAVEEKNKLESVLYAQFARVLNEKKKKIRELEDQVKQLRIENSEQKETIANRSITKLRPSPRYLSKSEYKTENSLDSENSSQNGDVFSEGSSIEAKGSKRTRIKACRSRTRTRSKLNQLTPTKQSTKTVSSNFNNSTHTPQKNKTPSKMAKKKTTNKIEAEDLLDDLDF